MNTDTLAPIRTGTCTVCKKKGRIYADPRDVERWRKGVLAQDALPYLSRDEREQLVTGTHPDCWSGLFDPDWSF